MYKYKINAIDLSRYTHSVPAKECQHQLERKRKLATHTHNEVSRSRTCDTQPASCSCMLIKVSCLCLTQEVAHITTRLALVNV